MQIKRPRRNTTRNPVLTSISYQRSRVGASMFERGSVIKITDTISVHTLTWIILQDLLHELSFKTDLLFWVCTKNTTK